MLRGSGRFERLLLPLFWLCAPAKVGACGRFRVAAESCYDALDGGSVIGWRFLHGAIVYIRALPASSRRTPRVVSQPASGSAFGSGLASSSRSKKSTRRSLLPRDFGPLDSRRVTR